MRVSLPRLSQLPVWQQDLVIAVGTWLLGLFFYLTGLYLIAGGPDPVPLWKRLIELTAIVGLEIIRRKVPLALILATGVLAVDITLGLSLPIIVVYTDFLYAATLYGSKRVSRAMISVAAVSTVAVITAALVFASDWRAGVIAAIAALPFLITPVWWATNVRQHRDIAQAERANSQQLARIAELDMAAAVAEERARMARDLHDVIAGHLSAIAIQSEAALSMKDPTLAQTVLRAVRENSVHALEEMRTMVVLLKSADGSVDETTAPARLAQLSKLVDSARASGISVDVRSEVDSTLLPAAVDLTAYRIAQEALTNAVKHAPGTRAVVEIRHSGGRLILEIGNELATRPKQPGGTGTGLVNMRERAAAVGGSLTAGPSAGGWLVRAELPVPGA
ncbi:sensor histidine kinase [Amycolatopsis sp. NPDC059657]|uniref:sensor histidine kinase n=1 Tax=Amycolatopsis sp. NPDC059657 TaxID=3346899 RepID=UPI00366E151F